MNKTHVYLCHKCNGTLTDHTSPKLYTCNCMSGYVRDWQTETPIEDAHTIQLLAVKNWLALYIRQGREESDEVVQKAKRDLARLTE
jgi:hypothetical protein